MHGITDSVFFVEFQLKDEVAGLMVAMNEKQSLFLLSYDQEFLLESFNEVRSFFPYEITQQAYEFIQSYSGPYQSKFTGVKLNGKDADAVAALILPVIMIIRRFPERFEKLLQQPPPDNVLYGFPLHGSMCFLVKNPDEELKCCFINSQQQFEEDLNAQALNEYPEFKESTFQKVREYLPATSANEHFVVTGLVAELIASAMMFQLAMGMVSTSQVVKPSRPGWASNPMNN